ncbi:hypothetical protein E4L96_18465 [Massilia arenosa]|uniref:Uncharacterized protein n=1 Tax=Zemynaea arenosa TaxID=2561931 RepID=A0A4Y9S0Z3_9BURK|nr:hypothetical protein [Massilia arenosa]TFW14994.1 hypothetical protein E4L96_18465 [Massilia arenosa]
MVTQHPGEPATPGATAAPPELGGFLASVRNLPSAVGQGLSAAATDDEQRILDTIIPVLDQQLSALTFLLGQEAERMSPAQAVQTTLLLNVTAAQPLAQSAIAIAGDLQQPVAKLSLSDIVHLIKKVVKALADIFGISLPGIILRGIDLIDELINGALGVGAPDVGVALMQRHRLQMAEQVELERLEEANQWRLRATQEGSAAVSAR